jgi:hypothetical protein
MSRRSIAVTIAALAMVGSQLPTAYADDHPIVGKWRWTRSDTNCTEVYDYRADGSLHVVSGAEISDSTYKITPEPDANGFYELQGQMVRSNGGRDCSDERADEPMKPYTIYVVFHKTQPLHLVCETPALEQCFGPLRRVNE